MYINRAVPRPGLETVTRKSLVKPRGQSESFTDTMASIIEVDVVEVGDHNEEKRRQQNPKKEDPTGARPEGEPKASLDIKA